MNILLLWTDEQRYDTLACYGNRRIGMPNLNRLSLDSTVFERAYCTSPVCTPSRGSILTGLWPHRHGAIANNVPLNAEARTLPELCRTERAGGYIGKWHLGDEIYAQHGWQHWVAIDDGYRRYYSPGRDRHDRCAHFHWLRENGVEPDAESADGPSFSRGFVAGLDECYSKPRFQADEAIRFIEEQGDSPWMLSVQMLEPHMPFTGPRNGQYSPAEIPASDNFVVAPDDSVLTRTRVIAHIQRTRGHAGFNPSDETSMRRCLANYWGLCSQVDHHFGRILDLLERKGLYDDTLIVFTSDHGDMMGSHALLAKCVMYEEAARVPLLIKLPGQREQRRVHAPVSQVDLVPTILDAAGEPVPDGLDGESLLDACRGGAQPARDVFMVWHQDDGHDNSNRADPEIPGLLELGPIEELRRHLLSESRCIVTTDGFKLIRSETGEGELYNLADDSCELRNLAPDPACAGLHDDLLSRLTAWQASVGDKLDLGSRR